MRTQLYLRMFLALLATVPLLTGCRIGPCGAHFYAPWKENFGGGDGSSLEKAITIRGATSEEQAFTKEEDYISPQLVDTRRTITHNTKMYHFVTTKSRVQPLGSSPRDLYFDVTKALRK
jgi:hypothetical protein